MNFKCQVTWCKEPQNPRHKFPKDHKRALEWLKVINRTDLASLLPSKLHSLMICSRHFDKNRHYYHPNISENRLLNNAVPLPELCEEPSTRNTVTLDHDHGYYGSASAPNDTASAVVSTVPQCDSTLNKGTELNESGMLYEQHPDRIEQEITEKNLPEMVEEVVVHTTEKTMQNDKHTQTTSRSVKRPGSYRKRRQSFTVSKLLFQVKKKLRNARKRTSKKFEELLYETKSFNLLSEEQKIFIKCQMRTAGQDPNGIRYTTDEKNLALSIFNRSPIAYEYIASLFKFPCARTLRRDLNKITLDSIDDKSTLE